MYVYLFSGLSLLEFLLNHPSAEHTKNTPPEKFDRYFQTIQRQILAREFRVPLETADLLGTTRRTGKRRM